MKLRWIDTSCFEIVTDENEVIVTDPYIDECENAPITSDDVQKMDYILITHTHFDHITQLNKYYEQYQPKICCSSLSSVSLLSEFDLSGQLIYGMDHKEMVDFGNTRITRISAKHSIPSRKERHFVRESQILGSMPFEMDDSYIRLMKTGYMDFSNFYIETKDNTRILFWGGGVTPEQINQAKEYRPDILLIQIPSNPNDKIVELIKTVGASIVIPHHHDTYYKSKDVDAMMETLKKDIESQCPYVKFYNPIPGKWYSFTKELTQL